MSKSKIGVVGLGVMGSALARNFESRGWKTSVYNRSPEKVENFRSEYEVDGHKFDSYKQLKRFISSLERPRKIVLMIKSGKPVDSFIEEVLPMLQKGDILIDGGNSYYLDTLRRCKDLEKKGIEFLGMGVSGGELGALKGPSMMPGGSLRAWEECKDILESAAAKDFKGKPCVNYMGSYGSGHLVKMVHNGIEYSIMQLLSETYQILRDGYSLDPQVIGEMFRRFNEGKLESYLVEICEPILKEIDEDTGKSLIDKILDKAGQKGTGLWTSRDAINHGVESSMLSQAVHARVSSSLKERRVKFAKKFSFGDMYVQPKESLEGIIPKLENAIYGAWIMSLEQGLDVIKNIAEEYEWEIDMKEVLRVWQGGCIIRAKILEDAKKSVRNGSLMSSKWFERAIESSYEDWKDVVVTSAEIGVPLFVFNTGLSSLKNAVSGESSANMIQGMRDYFGAHRFERKDKKSGTYHNHWYDVE